MLMSLVVAWSLILESSGGGVALPHNSSNYFSILAVGGKCGRISLWRVCAPECYSSDNTGHSGEVSLVGLLKVNGENLLKSSEVINDSLSLLKEIVTVDSATISVLSLTVPEQAPWKLLLAIGKSSGSLELWILDTSTDRFENVGCHNAHDRTVAGLAWAFGGCCLYSCSQNNSIKGWVFVGDSLCEMPIPLSNPGLKNSTDTLALVWRYPLEIVVLKIFGML